MTEVPGWGLVGETVPAKTEPASRTIEPFDEWRLLPVPPELSTIDPPDDVLKHAWHLDQNIYAAECLHCKPRHVDVSA